MTATGLRYSIQNQIPFPKLVEGCPAEDSDNFVKNYGDWLPKEFGGKAEMDGTELVSAILAEKDYLEQLRRTCDYNAHL